MSLIPISKLLATAVAHCSTDDDISAEIVKTVERHTDFFKGIGTDLDKSIPGFSLITTIGKGLTQALAPEIMGGLVEKVEYSKMREYLITPNPKDLNHDLSKLLKKAALTSLGYIKSLWFEKLKQAGDDEQIELLEGVFKQMKADLTSWLAYETIEDDILKDPSDCLSAITDYIFTTSSVNRDSEFASFFVDILPFCFKLAYKEALKDDDNKKAFIAFQIWILQSIDNKSDKILAAIEGLYALLQNNSTHLPKELTLKIPKIHPSEVIGREKELEELHQLLFDNKHVVVVNGMGGIGKTTLVQAYMSLYYDDYQHIVWISQSNETDIKNDFVNAEGLKENLKIATEGKDIEALYKEILSTLKALTDKPNLLLIDNAESSLTRDDNAESSLTRDFDRLPQQPNWHLLATSRANIERFHPKELGFLKPEKALELFKTHCQLIKDEDGIKDLLKVIDYHTLTIEILAKTAQKQHTRIEVLKTAIENDLKANVNVKHKGDKIDKVLTYLCSIFDLSKLNPHETWLMKQFACLPPEFINYELLLELIAPEGEEEENFAETLAELVSKGWLLANIETDSYKMHRIIAEVVLHKLNIAVTEVENLINSVSIKLSFDQIKENPIDKFQWIPYGKTIAENFEEETDNKITVLQNNLATVLKNLGEYEGAERLLEKVMRSDEKNFGEEHPSTARAYSNLATVLHDLGDYKGAKKLLEKATISHEKNFGEEHPTTAISYSNLATVLRDLGDYEGAKKLLEKAKIADEKNFGEEHPSTAIRYSNLGLVLQDLGDYEGAKKLLEKAKIADEKNFGEEHPSTARTYSNLATVLENLGYYEEAKKLLEKAKVADEKNFGEEHPNTVNRYSNLATVLRDLGDYVGAKTLLEKVMRSDEKNFGEEHPTTAIGYSNLASVLRNLGDYEGAKKLLEKAIISDESNFGEKHPNTAIRQWNLAGVLVDLEEFDQAHILLTKAYATFVLRLGTNHSNTQNCLIWLNHVKGLLNKG
jgi:tetratricopeptide (TPR) repeat protein